MKRIYLLPVITLSIMTFAVAGCDQPADQTGDAQTIDQTASAPVDPVAPAAPAPAETTPAPQEIQGGVMIQNAYAFETAAGSTTGAVFAVLHNSSSTEDSVIGATTDVAEKVELHQSTVDPATGVMNMALVDKIVVPAQGKVELTPNWFHAMLINLKSPLAMGQTFNVTFDFASGAKIEVPVTISAAGTSAAQPMAHDHGATGHDMTAPAPAAETTADPAAVPQDAVDAATEAAGEVVEEIAPAPESIPMPTTPAPGVTAPMAPMPTVPAPAPTPDAPAGQ